MLFYDLLQPCRVLCDEIAERCALESGPDFLVCVLRERIQVVANRAGEEKRLLRNDRDLRSEILQADLADVHAVDLDGASLQLDDSHQAEHERALSGACSAHHPDLLARENVHAELFDDGLQLGAIAHHDLVDGDIALEGPRFAGLRVGNVSRGFGGQLGVFLDAFHGDDLRLHVGNHANDPVEILRGVEGVTDRQSGHGDEELARGRFLEDGEERGGSDDDSSGEFEADAEPAIGRRDDEVGSLVEVEKIVVLLNELLLDLIRADHGSAVQRFSEIGVDGGARNGVQSLDLATALDVIAAFVDVVDGDDH